MTEFFNPEGICRFPGMSHCVKFGNVILIGGQVAVNEKGDLIGDDDPAAQAEQVFKNLGAVLAACNAKVTDIVKLNTYLADINDRSSTKEVRRKFLGEHCPVTTSFAVKSLASPDFKIEVDAVVVINV